MIRKRAVSMLRLAAAMSAVAQFVIAGAPIAESHFGPDAQAHVEAAGTSLHHAHDEATCVACITQHLLAASEPVRVAHFFVASSVAAPASAITAADSRSDRHSARPRAPPAA
ncbi:MAG: hypothetical protein ABI875_07675, partial [Gemmatimonadales bacterium]